MPSAEVIFQSANWAQNLTQTQADFYYTEIVNYLQEEVLEQVSEKYNKPIAMKYQNV